LAFLLLTDGHWLLRVSCSLGLSAVPDDLATIDRLVLWGDDSENVLTAPPIAQLHVKVTTGDLQLTTPMQLAMCCESYPSLRRKLGCHTVETVVQKVGRLSRQKLTS